MKKRVRIKDVAQKAGVSTGTVDRVIHNRGNVAPEVQERVLKVMKELGFQRNLIASALAKNETYRIAVLLPNYNDDPYWVQSFEGVKAANAAFGHYGLLIEYHFFELLNPADFHVQAIQMLKTDPDAIIFPPLFTEEGEWLARECEIMEVPCVTFNTEIIRDNLLTYIGQDSYQSGVLAARLLRASLRNDSTAIILNLSKGSSNAIHLIQKKEGFEDYFKNQTDKQINVVNLEFENFNNPDELRSFLLSLKHSYPNIAGFFFTNSRAYKAIEAVKDEHYFDQLAVVGFDLIEQNISLLKQEKINFLINQNPLEQGYLSLQSLYHHLLLKKSVEKVQYLPLDIVVRENYQYYATSKNQARSSILLDT